MTFNEVFKCVHCKKKYKNCKPGPQPDCRRCGSRYLKWVTWEKWYSNESTYWGWKRK